MKLGMDRLSLVLLVVVSVISSSRCQGQTPAHASTPTTFFDESLRPLRDASLSWELRIGPRRSVVDQVCLVPDIATFFEAIGTWDQTKWFPILIDDVPLTARFLKAFRPAKVIRYSKKVPPIESADLWKAAAAAVGKSWAMDDERATPGDQLPTKLGSTPPGLVFTSPTSAAFAGAVALAAGRYQTLVRWEPSFKEGEIPAEGEAARLAREIEAKVATLIPEYRLLGDSCDFLTLAGPYPYRYNTKDGNAAFDDLIGRDLATNGRWAFTGRLLGDARESVYRAMCSLFLQPETGLLFNTYDRNPPWNEYAMERAVRTLANRMQITSKNLPEARFSDWQRAISSGTNFGLIMLNSSGSPSSWSIQGGPGHPADVPIFAPSVVLIVHSFSAADPQNLDTIAGRWLAGGAYIYFGSMNEPYLNAFRTPTLVASLIDEGLPLGAAMRQLNREAFGQPWRLVYLGDPLYRLEAKSSMPAPRLPPEAQFPAYVSAPIATVPKDPASQLSWALKTSILRWSTRSSRSDDVIQLLLALPREGLDPSLKPIFDTLVIENLLPAGRRADLRAKLAKVPQAERGVDFKMAFEASYVQDVEIVVQSRDASRGIRLWTEMIRSPISLELKGVLTERLVNISDSPITLADWRTRFQAVIRDPNSAPEADMIREAMKKVEAKLPKK